MTRERLPDRRQHEAIDFQHGGFRYVAGIGRFPDGRVAEMFFNTAKTGTAPKPSPVTPRSSPR